MTETGGHLEQFALAPEAIERWTHAAKPGERLTYARGAALPPRSPGAAKARALGDAGLLCLAQHPPVRGVRDYVAERTEQALICAVVPARAPRRVPTAAERRVLDAIEEAARRRKPCPSNRTIAVRADLRDRFEAKYLLRKLQAKGLITVEPIDAEPKRVVTITGSAMKTGVRP